MDQARPDGGGAIHVAVWVPYEQAEARIAAALAAGGRMVRDQFAPAWWTLADAAGNEADIATTKSRDLSASQARTWRISIEFGLGSAPGRNRTCCLAVRSRGQTISNARFCIPTSSVQYQVVTSLFGRVATSIATVPPMVRRQSSIARADRCF
jgi:hypothetical protein